MGVFAMPSLGADMEDGTLVEWLVAPGDPVRRGDVLAVVETQKGAIEIEVFEDGVVETLTARVGERLPVGAPLARIRGAEVAVAAEAPAAVPAKPPPAPVEPRREAPAAASRPPPVPGGPPPSSPAARARAAETGVDLASIRGTGPGGAIRLADVEASTGPAPEPVPRGRARGPAKPGLDPEAMRAAIAAAMTRSKREIPHYYLSQTIDLQPAADWLAQRNAGRTPDERLLMGALLVRATALAARDVPEVNGHFGPDGFRPAERVHAGVAVALRGGGLIAPAIHDADLLTLDDLMAAMRDLVARARTGRLRSSEMTDATITVSSLGDGGAEGILGVIYPPQVALVGFGAALVRPWVVDGAVVARTLVTASLSADHRASDGRRGARFLARIAARLANPETP